MNRFVNRTLPKRLLFVPNSSYSARITLIPNFSVVLAREPAQLVLQLLAVGSVALLPSTGIGSGP